MAEPRLRRAAASLLSQRTNQLFVSDVPSKLEEITAMIAKIDVPVRQVLIEARIVEANDRFWAVIGVKLGGYDARGCAAASWLQPQWQQLRDRR